MSLTLIAPVRKNKPKRSAVLSGAAGLNCFIIDRYGRMWSWGSSGLSSGRADNNASGDRNTPISILGAVKTFCSIEGGRLTAIALDKNGQAWGWGYNNFGNIGDGTQAGKCTPVSVAGAKKTFCKIAMGNVTGVAIDKNGRAWGWGANSSGSIGDNSSTQRLTPVSVLGAVKTFCKIGTTGLSNTTVAIDKNGQVWAWGGNSQGNLGDNTIVSKFTPVSILGATKTFCQIFCGRDYTIALDKNGRAWGWGYNGGNRLGDGTTTSRRTPVSVIGATKTFCKLNTGSSHSTNTFAIDKNGGLWGWGSGPLGDGRGGAGSSSPVRIAAGKTFCTITVGTIGFGAFTGATTVLAIDKNGRVWSWGSSLYGKLGNAIDSCERTPISISGATKTFCEISAGNNFFFSHGIDKNGRAWGWGDNGGNQLGVGGSTGIRATPVSVAGAVKTFCKISGGQNHSAAIDKNGGVWAWGANDQGQLGDNTLISKNTPVSILGAAKTFCHIHCGYRTNRAIDQYGIVWGWGANQAGQIGNNSTANANTPVSVAGTNKTFCKISAGGGTVSGGYSVAIDKNGRAWGWGLNDRGQLGDGTRTQRLTPVSVIGAVKTFCEIVASAEGQYTLAIDKNGQAWGWGQNTSGQIGNNATNTSIVSPVSVVGAVKTFCKIDAGFAHSIALDKNGEVWTWGANSRGELGDGTTTSKLTPVSISGVKKTFCRISAGNNFCLAVDKNGKSWGWGYDAYNNIGANNRHFQTTPVQVCNI